VPASMVQDTPRGWHVNGHLLTAGLETAFNPKEPYFDPKSDRSNPKWYLVKVRFLRKFTRLVGLHELKSYGGPGGELANMPLIKMSRLSVSPVGKAEWDFILNLERKSQ